MSEEARAPDVMRFYCKVCQEATPHELNEDHTKSRCLECKKKKPQIALPIQRSVPVQTPEARHWSALDGMGNRGEGQPPMWTRPEAPWRKEKKKS